MPYGYGFGRGRGRGWGMGFGFRGSSPPWPYVGRGRGGLPRCGYYFQEAYPGYYPAGQGRWAGPTAAPSTGLSEKGELGSLRDEARAMREQLDSIEARIREMESE